MKAAGSKAALIGGIGPATYAAASRWWRCWRSRWRDFWCGRSRPANSPARCFWSASPLFGWQIGGFIRRNRPRSYTFDSLPDALLP